MARKASGKDGALAVKASNNHNPPYKTPFADLLPPLSEDEFEALKARIEEDGGVMDAVVLDDEGNVLDGHTRLKIDPDAPTRSVRGFRHPLEKPAYVLRTRKRRNLSREQERDCVKKCGEIALELHQADQAYYTQERLGRLFGVAQQRVSDWFHSTDSGTVQVPPPDSRTVLTAEGKAAAVAEVEAGKPQEQVAANFHVSPATISRAVARHRKEKEASRKRKAAARSALDLGESGIVHGDYRKLGERIGDGCVDLVFTDPPYNRETLPQYEDLGFFANRVLKPGGSLICYLGDYQLPEVLNLVLAAKDLRFWWPLACIHTGQTTNMKQWGVIVRHKLMLWFVKGKTRADKGFVESLVQSEREKDGHDWQQGLPEALYYIEKLTPLGGLVVDPYCGAGTTCAAALRLNRSYVAFEIDPQTAAIARGRLKKIHDQAI